MPPQHQGWYIAAPFLVSIALMGIGVGAVYVMRAFLHPRDVEEERGAAGLLLILTFACFLLAFIALAIGIYALVVHFAA